MLFNVERDSGDEIVGYLIPDGFSGSMYVRVLQAGEELIVKETDGSRPAIAAAGRHDTGMCGFSITEADIPNLATMQDLELREASTNLLIYRRCDPSTVIQKRVLRLETHLLPSFRLDRALGPHFQFFFPAVDRFALETVWQTFLIANTSSVYVSGRLHVRAIDRYLDDSLEVFTLLHDPFVELAERLLFFRAAGERDQTILSARDSMLFGSAKLFAFSLDLGSEKELRRSFRDIDPDARLALSNPVVRQLTSRLPDQPAKASALREALSTLSGFKQVGLRSRADLFSEGIGAALGLQPEHAPPIITQVPAAERLSGTLRSIPWVEDLIEHDLALYEYVSEAFDRSLVPFEEQKTS